MVVVCWLIWKERKARTFDQHAVDALLDRIADELVAWCQGGLKHLEPLVLALGRLSGRTINSL